MEERLLKLKTEIMQLLQDDIERSHKAMHDFQEKYNEDQTRAYLIAEAEARGSAIAYGVALMHVDEAFSNALKEEVPE